MTLGPITHAGSNWRKLCRSYHLDPMTATAADVENAILQAVSVNQELLTACTAAEAHMLEDPAHPAHAEHRLAIFELLSNAISHALQQRGAVCQ